MADAPTPRFRLTEPHYLPGDVYVGAGTVIGAETPYPLSLWEHKDPKTKKDIPFRPSISMEPLDDEAQSILDDNPMEPAPEDALDSTVSGPVETPHPAGAPLKQLPNGKNPNKDSSPKDS